MRRRLICVAVVSATVLVVSGQSGKARAASFDCKNASNMVERLICTDPDLSQMDERLATAYSAARSQSADSKKLRSEQLAWISQRNHCLTAACVSESYNKRLAELGGGSRTIVTSEGETKSNSQNFSKIPPIPTQAQIRAYRAREKTILEKILNYTYFASEEGRFSYTDDSSRQKSEVFGSYFTSGDNDANKCIMTVHHIDESNSWEKPILDIRNFSEDGFSFEYHELEGQLRILSFWKIGDENNFIRGDPRDVLERLQKAWGIAFQECPGKKSAF